MTDARRKWLDTNAEYLREYKRIYNAAHREQNKASSARWLKRNKGRRKQYYASNRVERNALRRDYKKRKRQNDPNFQITENLRTRIWKAIKVDAGTKQQTTAAMLGCSIASFRMYLESKFEPGMSWENYGYGWHVDHIMPCAIFDLTKPDHQKRCFHFSNLQPLWANDNLTKRCSVPVDQFAI
jgi:hypothetical protein